MACARTACPGAIAQECGEFLTRIEGDLPTVVFAASDSDGKELSAVTVFVDDERVAEQITGRAVVVDPGEHKLRFVDPGGRTVDQTLIVHEGEKNRRVVVTFQDAARAQTFRDRPAPAPAARGIPTLSYVLGGIGVAAVGSFAGFGIAALSRGNDLSSRCAPNCTGPGDASEIDTMRRDGIIADISLGTAIVCVGVAVLLVVTKPSRVITPGVSSRR